MIRSRLLAFLLFIVSTATSLSAQGPLKSLWAKYAVFESFAYSRDGSTILGRYGSEQFFIRASDGVLTATTFVAAGDSVLANDGSGLYYSDGTDIWFYNPTTDKSTKVRTESSGITNYGLIDLSPDGSQLAYQVNNANNNRFQLTIANTNGTLAARVSLASGESMYRLAFTGNGRVTIVTNKGIRSYTTTGTLLASRNGTSYRFMVVPPDGSRVYAWNGNIGSGTPIEALNPGTLAVSWTANSPFYYKATCSSDGSRLIGANATGAVLCAITTTDGSQLAGSFSSGSGNSYAAVAASPAVNQVIAFDSQHYRVESWSFDANFTGTQLADITEGNIQEIWQNFLLGGQTTFSGYDPVYNRLRDAATGQLVASAPVSRGDLISPDGKWFARTVTVNGNFGVGVFRLSDGVRVAFSAPNSLYWDIGTQGWMGNNRLFVSTSAGNGHLRVLDFDGNSLRLITDVTPYTYYRPATGSVDGTKIAQAVDGSGGSYGITVYDAATGAVVGTRTAQYNSLYPKLVFTSKGELCVLTADSDFRASFLDPNLPTLPVLRSASVGSADSSYHLLFNVSPDGSLVAFTDMTANYRGRLRLVRSADNTLLSTQSVLAANWLTSIDFSSDNRVLMWVTNYSNAAFGAEAPVVLSGLSVAPITVIGGSSATATVTLNHVAPTGGTVVSLSGAAGLTIPATVIIPEGQVSATFSVGTSGVDTTTAKTIYATYDGLTLSTNLTVTPPTALTIAFSPGTVTGGAPSTGTITLNGLAGPNGLVVSLASGNPVVTVPASVTIAAQASTATFTATTTDPATTSAVTVTGTAGSATGSGILNVTSTGGLQLGFDTNPIKGGNAIVHTLTVGQAAPAGGSTYTLSSSDPSIAPPASVTIPAGALSVSIGVPTNPVLADILATLTAAKDGFSKLLTATVLAPQVKSLNPAVTSLVGNTTVSVLVLLDGPAPNGMSLSASSNSSFATVPAAVAVPAGQAFAVATVTIKKTPVARAVTITIAGKTVKLNLRPAQ